ncbi:hypothetical protein [Bordetella genomosp. 1]|uniref:Lipoprotein n=1 Tax=Bordetella genomosp. 1 TaxID=1395607 RepID=A0ABX4EY81_9BORD|nr:hypothetical protein [Bordetella genomosp. 1]OZI64033.1 hypothetical protein CAL27_15730 [Bordetella genomosp. 1]
MAVKLLNHLGAAAALVLLVAGCSSSPKREADAAGPTTSAASADIQCKISRRLCMHEGSYESGERDYAEQEARRLNLAEAERLRKAFGR